MEIHKPKPWHGLREFLKEYGIIVLGVLTALAAEQAVEWLHWQHVLQEERAALGENAQSIYSAMHARTDMQPCIDAKLADIATILRRHELGQPLGITGPIGRPSFSGVPLGAFDMAMTDQSFSHMPIAEKRGYFSMKSTFELFSLNREIELEAWRTLRALDRASTFTAADWADVARANDRAVDANEVFKNNLKAERKGQWLFPFRSLPRPGRSALMQVPWVVQLCRPAIAR